MSLKIIPNPPWIDHCFMSRMLYVQTISSFWVSFRYFSCEKREITKNCSHKNLSLLTKNNRKQPWCHHRQILQHQLHPQQPPPSPFHPTQKMKMPPLLPTAGLTPPSRKPSTNKNKNTLSPPPRPPATSFPICSTRANSPHPPDRRVTATP